MGLAHKPGSMFASATGSSKFRETFNMFDDRRSQFFLPVALPGRELPGPEVNTNCCDRQGNHKQQSH